MYLKKHAYARQFKRSQPWPAATVLCILSEKEQLYQAGMMTLVNRHSGKATTLCLKITISVLLNYKSTHVFKQPNFGVSISVKQLPKG